MCSERTESDVKGKLWNLYYRHYHFLTGWFFTMYMGFIVYIVLLCMLRLTVFCKCPVCIVVGLSVCVVFLCIYTVLNVLVFAQLPGGWLEVRTRKVLRPATSTQVFLLDSLCLKANAEMVPNFPSCHYMLLMWPSITK
jgi:hypothetical protein